MHDDAKGNRSPIDDVRKLPILIAFAAGLFFKQAGVWSKGSITASGLGEIAYTAAAFLLVIALYYDVEALLKRKRSETAPDASTPSDRTHKRSWIRVGHFFGKIKAFLSGKRKNQERDTEKTAETIKTETAETTEKKSDLIEIRSSASRHEAEKKLKRSDFEVFISFLYVVLLFVRPFEHLRTMRGLRTLPPPEGAIAGVTVMDAIGPLVLSCFIEIYLKMRKNNGRYAADKTSYGLLKILSCASLVSAAAIAATAVLRVDAVVVLPWVYALTSIYMVAAMAAGLAIAFMKGDIHENFDYTLTPTFLKRGYKSEFLDSQEVKSRFSVKSLWTIRYTMKVLPGALLFLGSILYLSTTLYVVEPHQEAALYRLGRLHGSIVGPGMHVKLPWPIDQAAIYDVDRTRTMQIGYQSPDARNFLWTLPHEGGENMLLLGNGNELAAVNMKVCYKISDLLLYVKTCTNPSEILSAAAYEALTNRTLSTTMDNFLSIDRSSLSESLAEELSRICEAENLGLSVVQVIVESIHPPVAVADVYQKVVTAAVEKNAVVTRAHVNATAKLIQAERQRKTDVDKARVAQFARTSEAESEMAVYYAGLDAYKTYPASFRLTKTIDAFGPMVDKKKVYVFSPGTENDLSRFVIGNNLAPLYLNSNK